MAAFTDFENRIAVLTGGASGIGLLLQLVKNGTHVAVCDLDPGNLARVAVSPTGVTTWGEAFRHCDATGWALS